MGFDDERRKKKGEKKGGKEKGKERKRKGKKGKIKTGDDSDLYHCKEYHPRYISIICLVPRYLQRVCFALVFYFICLFNPVAPK